MSQPAQTPPTHVAKLETELHGPVVGIGTSAGGLEALKAFFALMPEDSGMSFVVIQHLAPDHHSALADILSSSTKMPVQQLINPTAIKINSVYVCAPDSVVIMKERNLIPMTTPETGVHRLPIDYFLRSLAVELQENAVGILLSGAGSDGTLGLQTIKRFGGLTLVQTPDSARFDAMPKSAVKAGVVDYALTIDEMASQIVSYFAFRSQNAVGTGSEEELTACLPAIFKMLHEALGHDFSRYKQTTLMRRIRRRMQMLRIKPAQAYADVLGKDPKEAQELFRDLIIGVTEFFRDTETFELLGRQVIPKLFQNLDASGTLRLWVAGCATGEEAYSMAILVREHMAKTGESHPVQIFATDIDADAVEVARQGFYKEEIREQVSEERLTRFFLPREGGYQIQKEIREMCVFSVHNLAHDPPFSRMDMVSCRNVLIYFDATLQQRVISLFHYALNSKGYLLLGPAESLGGHADLFHPIDKKSRLFQIQISSSAPAVRLPRPDMARTMRNVGDTGLKVKLARERDARETHEQALLDWYVPPSVLLDGDGNVLHFAKQTARYLHQPVGAPSNNIFDLVRDELRIVLRAALTQARKDDQEITKRHIGVGLGEHITLVVRPLNQESRQGRFLILFREEQTGSGSDASPTEPRSEEAEAVHQLEKELRLTKQWLQTTVEELENSNEELKSSNEELISINEEYQSANEALQTSKEELQSLNEELETVNLELSKKVDELDLANADMRGLFASSAIATIFVDQKLAIRRFTSTASQLFSLIETDVGRPLSDISARFDTTEVIAALRRAVQGESVPEIEIHIPDDNSCFVGRMTPTYGIGPKPTGIVLNVIDVTELTRAKEALGEAAIRKDEFLALLGHELRNPLAPLTMGLVTLRNEALKFEHRQEIHDIFERQVGQLTKIVDDLLDVSRISRGLVLLRKEIFDLTNLVANTFSDYRALFDSRSISLNLALEGDPLWLEGDQTRLRQVISNLLTNAVKFTPSGGKVQIIAVKDGVNAKIIVKDSGRGIDARTIARLFEPLSQGAISIDRQGAGLGLGLALVKGLTELHQGSVSAASPGLDLGSTFTVILPLSEKRPELSEETDLRTAKQLRIVIIEDNEDAARALELVLKSCGHEVSVAGTGKLGIELVQRNDAQAVICDIGLPDGMDGYAVAAHLRKMEFSHQLLLVALSGYGQENDKKKAIDAGFNLHLTKPIDYAQVEKLFGKCAK